MARHLNCILLTRDRGQCECRRLLRDVGIEFDLGVAADETGPATNDRLADVYGDGVVPVDPAKVLNATKATANPRFI
jgi:hypothetical protein